MLKQRIATAVVLVALLAAALIYLSPTQLSLLFAIVVAYAGWEWAAFVGLQTPLSRFLYTGFIAGLIASCAFLFGLGSQINESVIEAVCVVAVVWWLLGFYFVKSYPASLSLWSSVVARGAIGVLVLLPAWCALVALFHSTNGYVLLLWIVAIVAMADVGAYFTGKAFGRHKLAPNVSPGKTWEGVAGGLTVNALVAGALVVWLQIELSAALWVFALVLVTAAVSVVGDLLESMLKRNVGLKDSGNILPGHGGVLDRIDGFTAALPTFVLIMHISQLAPTIFS
ncbi:MAG: phosphatidate cytidylyltransferase [bacterium]